MRVVFSSFMEWLSVHPSNQFSFRAPKGIRLFQVRVLQRPQQSAWAASASAATVVVLWAMFDEFKSVEKTTMMVVLAMLTVVIMAMAMI